MALGARISKGTGIEPEKLRDYVDLAVETSEKGAAAVMARLLKFTEPPPSPGDAADWTVDNWLAFGRRNNMNDVTRAKHGTKITHDFATKICVVPSGTPGDVRAGMNCAADFRRVYRREVDMIRLYFQWLTPMVTTGGLLLDGRTPTPSELVKAACAFSLADDEKVLTGLGFPGFRDRVADDVEINVAKVYSAMTYLAGSFTPARSYPQVILEACAMLHVHLSRDQAGMISKRVGQAFRTKTPLVVPVAWAIVLDNVVEQAVDAKEQIALEREIRKLDRVVDAERRATSVDPVAVIKAAVAKANSEVVERVGKLGYEIAQLTERFDKVKRDVAAVDFDEIEALMLAQAKRAADAEAGVQLAESALQAKRAALEDIAKVCGVDLGTADFESALLAKIVSMRDVSTSAEAIRKKHVDFATKVHDKLAVKDFLSIAASINELMPEAERIALSGGEEE